MADCGGGGGTPGGPTGGRVSTTTGGGAGGAIGGGEGTFGLAIVGGGGLCVLNCLTGGEATLLSLGEPEEVAHSELSVDYHNTTSL